jgi:hypothetical protein
MKTKKLTTKELRKLMIGLCQFCNRPEKDHLPVMAPEGVQLRCLDVYVCEDGKFREYKP